MFLGTKAGAGVGQLDVELLSTLNDGLAVLGRHVVRDLRIMGGPESFTVAQYERLCIKRTSSSWTLATKKCLKPSLLMKRVYQVNSKQTPPTDLLVVAEADLGHNEQAGELPADAVINTTGLAPSRLERLSEISFQSPNRNALQTVTLVASELDSALLDNVLLDGWSDHLRALKFCQEAHLLRMGQKGPLIHVQQIAIRTLN